MVVASLAQPAKATLLDQLALVTSNGVQAFSLADCIYEGTVCFDMGSCVSGACVCDKDREGTFCENAKSTCRPELPGCLQALKLTAIELACLSCTGDDNSLAVVLGAVLGSTIPVFLLLLIAAIALGVGCWLLGRSSNGRQDWEIDFDELEMGDILGAGGYRAPSLSLSLSLPSPC
jgi:hypothetical protein